MMTLRSHWLRAQRREREDATQLERAGAEIRARYVEAFRDLYDSATSHSGVPTYNWAVHLVQASLPPRSMVRNIMLSGDKVPAKGNHTTLEISVQTIDHSWRSLIAMPAYIRSHKPRFDRYSFETSLIVPRLIPNMIWLAYELAKNYEVPLCGFCYELPFSNLQRKIFDDAIDWKDQIRCTGATQEATKRHIDDLLKNFEFYLDEKLAKETGYDATTRT